MKGGTTMAKTSPHLWYTDKADEAAAFYASNG
jgi:predicted 3-demethylubiquinone-9 3-methyltransferase (glyoxalase superfamily)